jgi:hypothetical protein
VRPCAWELSEGTWKDGSFTRDSERYIKEEAENGLSVYRGSIMATWSGAPLIGTPTDRKEGNCALLG